MPAEVAPDSSIAVSYVKRPSIVLFYARSIVGAGSLIEESWRCAAIASFALKLRSIAIAQYAIHCFDFGNSVKAC